MTDKGSEMCDRARVQEIRDSINDDPVNIPAAALMAYAYELGHIALRALDERDRLTELSDDQALLLLKYGHELRQVKEVHVAVSPEVIDEVLADNPLKSRRNIMF